MYVTADQLHFFKQSMFVAGYGGVYTGMAVEGEAMSGAKKAAKMAETQAIFEDESLVGALENRNVRKAVYIPTFFTNVPQQQPHPVAQRFSRDTQVPTVGGEGGLMENTIMSRLFSLSR